MSAPATKFRQNMLAKVHIAKKALALDDESYRDLLQRVTGQRSATNLDTKQLDAVIAEFKRIGWMDGKKPTKRAGSRPLADAPMAKKIRALWLDLYHLGALRDPSEEALAAFVEKTAGVAALQWLDGEQANTVIEALLGWLARVGWKRPTTAVRREVDLHRHAARIERVDDGFLFKLATMRAQWAKLVELGVFRNGEFAQLDTWVKRQYGINGATLLSPADADDAVEKLGAWVRREVAKRGSA